jgi:ketosteroid isomerase-like protein
MRSFPIARCVSLLLSFQLLPAMAENIVGSQVASNLTTAVAAPKTETQIIREMLVKMLERWNARDIDGMMSAYWNSPSLIAVIDTEQFDGWEDLYRSYKNQSRNPTNMGIVNPTRVQVQLLKPDLAFGIVSWTMRYPENAHASQVVGTTTMNLQKFDSGWKIVVLHSSYAEI